MVNVNLGVDGVADSNKATVGKFMWWNAADANNNGIFDKDEEPSGGIADENTLVALKLNVVGPQASGNVRLTITTGSDKVKIWQESTKKTKLTPTGTPPSLCWLLSTMPSNLFLEGVAGSTNIRDVGLQLAYEPPASSPISDSVKVTVVPLLIIGHATADLYNIRWCPNGDYALAVGDNGTVAKYTYPCTLTDLPSGTSERMDAITWNPSGAFAVLAGGMWPGPIPAGHMGPVLTYNGSTFANITPANVPGYNPSDPNSRQYAKFWDASWKPGGNYCLLVGESGQICYKCDGTNTLFVGGAGSNDTTIVDWKPDASYAMICGDIGGDWKWSDGGGFTNFSSAFPDSNGLLEFTWRPDGAEALVGGTCLTIWKYTEAAGTTILRAGSGEPTDWITGIMWEPNGHYAIICGAGGLVLLYDPSDSSLHEVNCGTTKYLEKGAWKPNGNYATVVRHN